jgi:uncharacterized protein (TIGR03089 family)
MSVPGGAAPTPAPATFPAALDRLLRRDATRPLVTFYDDATGERVELSVATYANWVAKTAGLARDELDLERGGRVLLDLPTHWLGAVWLGAAWTLGAAVTDDRALREPGDLVVCGPDRLADHVRVGGPVVGLSLRPLGARFSEPLPPEVVDYGAVVLGQPDDFVAGDPPDAEDVAWVSAEDTASQSTLLTEAVGSSLVAPGGRLLTDVNPIGRAGAATLLAGVLLDASTVWVRHPDEGRWAARAEQERATSELRAGTAR